MVEMRIKHETAEGAVTQAITKVVAWRVMTMIASRQSPGYASLTSLPWRTIMTGSFLIAELIRSVSWRQPVLLLPP